MRWEVVAGNRETPSLCLGGCGKDEEPVPRSSAEVVGVKPALQSLLKV